MGMANYLWFRVRVQVTKTLKVKKKIVVTVNTKANVNCRVRKAGIVQYGHTVIARTQG